MSTGTDAKVVGFLDSLDFHYLLCKTDFAIILEVTIQKLDELNIFYNSCATETQSGTFKAKKLEWLLLFIKRKRGIEFGL